ncbi:MAG: homoserine dehydrogenase [Alphaproteobacteria bacterium]|nr:homoserine dehydrogenase [Alphaproteobacteria bacterium]
MSSSLKIAIAGLGTVGVGVIKLFQQQKELLYARTGCAVEITAVSARTQKDRGVSLNGMKWYDDAVEMAKTADADVIIELIGGSTGVAKNVCEAAIDAGRHVVTANKALMAVHGNELALKAEKASVALSYEAAVAGGIPIIKSMREGLIGNKISNVYGILNGTCNYILTMMRETGREFDDVLKEAQELGYAESDPSFDIDGIDAAHKIALLASLAFGCPVNFKSVSIEGVRRISQLDIEYAEELGYRIKLLGIARKDDNGVQQRVHLCMVPKELPIANVDGVLNAVVTEGDFVGRTVLEGRGAGESPTASAVVADVMDIVAGKHLPVFGIPAKEMEALPSIGMDEYEGSYYVRLIVKDERGVIASIATALSDENVSVKTLLQRQSASKAPVPVIMVLHKAKEVSVKQALAKIEELDAIVEPPYMIRIKSF